MAFIRQPFQTKKGESGTIGTTPGGATDTPQGTAPTSDWVNLQNYIAGNQGTGQEIANQLVDPGRAANANFQAEASNFKNLATNQIAGGQKQARDWYADPAHADLSNLSDAQKTDYQDWLKQADYSGPNSASEITQAPGTEPSPFGLQNPYDAYKGAQTKAADTYRRYGSQEGLQGLAAETLGKGNANYTGGMSLLDTILAQQAGGGGTLEKYAGAKAGQNAANIDRAAKMTGESIDNQIAQAKFNATGTTDRVKSAVQQRYDQEGDLKALQNLESVGAQGHKAADKAQEIATAEAKQREDQAKAAQDQITKTTAEQKRMAETAAKIAAEQSAKEAAIAAQRGKSDTRVEAAAKELEKTHQVNDPTGTLAGIPIPGVPKPVGDLAIGTEKAVNKVAKAAKKIAPKRRFR